MKWFLESIILDCLYAFMTFDIFWDGKVPWK